ncbi:hypothetical protein [Pseudonocardia sp. HH130630-07]|uniref:hypothetical protein n=1 Tax=Pseudonocardia sp. HH130630-07 TaxID=1690815 RepID=UPI000814FC0C|nr:hypothetical protein [Pseudonocardia sp. HH130630-07]ANY10701.1 hypothetical protein AFB00_30305 [Pseudonocardia sp. HH130630-07]
MTDDTAGHWISRTVLADAATITVCTGASVAQVLDGFGAHHIPEPIDRILDSPHAVSWVRVRDLGGGIVLACEDNDFQGSTEPVLRHVSTGGRAASEYWNAGGMHCLSFAEHGTVLSATLDYAWTPILTNSAAVNSAIAGLDFLTAGTGAALTAIGRFTGHHLQPEQMHALLDTDQAHRMTPA